MELIFHRFDLQLKHPFTIAHETRTYQPTLILEFRHEGISGFGEATETRYYGVSIDEMCRGLSTILPILQTQIIDSPERIWEILNPQLSAIKFAQCALDVAIHDWWGKKNQRRLYQIWGLSPEKNPLSNYTIGIDSIEKMVQKMKEIDFPIYKIKLGTKEDIKIITELRKHTQAVFRVDANTAWTEEETLINAKAFQNMGVEFIEQPLSPQNTEGMAFLKNKCPLPLIADESCILEKDVENCSIYFDGINIKLMKCGGITPARRMIAKAKKKGLKAMVGCMTESVIGCSAVAQLMPYLDYVDVDGMLLVNEIPAKGISIDKGKVQYSDGFGTGAELLFG